MPNPNDLSSYDMLDEQNPFMDIIAKAQGVPGVDRSNLSEPNQGQPQPEAQASQGKGALAQVHQSAQEGAQQGAQPAPEPNQLEKGVNLDSTKYLLGAVQSLEKYITESTDRDEIATARSIISLLSRLIAKDQENMSAQI